MNKHHHHHHHQDSDDEKIYFAIQFLVQTHDVFFLPNYVTRANTYSSKWVAINIYNSFFIELNEVLYA